MYLPVAPRHLLGVHAVGEGDLAHGGSPVVRERARIGWVVPSVWPGSGGHHDIFRIVQHLEGRGHHCTVFQYEPLSTQTLLEFESISRRHFAQVSASFQAFDERAVHDLDALIATSWHTAYPVASCATAARRTYFVQDFEPSFYAMGSEYVLAENTYRLGLRGITLGPWLATMLNDRYGMACDAIDFQADLDTYSLKPGRARDGVCFYARPVSPRRGFEIGLLALEVFHELRPEVPIHLFGWNLDGWPVPFPHRAHGILDARGLSQLYNESNAALVMSLTNLSLIPMELLASGCIPVVNQGANNELNLRNRHVIYAPATPQRLAEGLVEAVGRSVTGGPALASELASSVTGASWNKAGEQFERLLLGAPA